MSSIIKYFSPASLLTPAATATTTYTIEIDTLRDQSYNSVIDDVSSFVVAATWTQGMRGAYDDFAEPSQANITLDNKNGDFVQEVTGSELVSNGDFSAWTADDPDDWTVTGESGGDPEVSEVGRGETHGGTDTGACNLYTTSAALSISQTILTIGLRYRVTFMLTAITGTGGVVVSCGGVNVSPVYHVEGMKTFSFTATATDFTIAANGAANVTIDNVSCKNVPLYYGALAEGTLIRIRCEHLGLPYQLWVGLITAVEFDMGLATTRHCRITAQDAMLRLLDVEYFPRLQTNVTVNQVLNDIFDRATIVYPYAHEYWMLEVEGSSEAGTTTNLYAGAFTLCDFDQGITILPFAGDNANQAGNNPTSGGGVSAQQYMRQLVSSEIGGRFYWDGRKGKFVFVSRHADIYQLLSKETIASSDLVPEGSRWVYGADVINQMTIKQTPRELGDPGSVIWEYGALPIRLRRGESKKIIAHYADTVNELPIGATDVINPLPNTDYAAYLDEGGTGTNLTGYLGITYNINAQSAEITVFNSSQEIMYVTLLRLRGTPLRTFEQQSFTAIDGESIYQNTMKPKTLSLPLIDEDTAINAANYMISRFAKPFMRLAVGQIIGDSTNEGGWLTSIIQREIGDRITITDSWSGHDQDYVIVGESHVLDMAGDQLHRCSWVLKPILRDAYWLVGVSGRSELDETTLLGF